MRGLKRAETFRNGPADISAGRTAHCSKRAPEDATRAPRPACRFQLGRSLRGQIADRRPLIAVQLAPVEAARWNVYKATSGEFVTCDRPAIPMWADPTKTEPVGLGLRHTRLLFPLSSDVAISGGFELDDATVDVDDLEVSRINGRIILNANRQVYARDEGFEYSLGHNTDTKRGNDLPTMNWPARFKGLRCSGPRVEGASIAQRRPTTGASFWKPLGSAQPGSVAIEGVRL